MKKTKLETDYEVLLQGIEKLSVLTIGAYENTLEALKTLDLEIALQIIKQDQDIDDLQEDITEESTILLFNKPSEWTYRDWLNSDARYLLMDIPKDVVEWVYENYMTEDEKKAHPSYKTTGGYLKILDESECAQIWWDGLSEADRNKIKSIPNFDIEIFEQCTGIKIESEGK